MLQRLRGQIALDARHGGDAVPLLIDAARQLEPLDPALARETHLEALRAASIAGRLGVGARAAAEAARRAPSPQGPPRAVDLLLEGLAVRFTDGYAASAPALKRALSEVRDQGRRAGQDVRWPWTARRVAPDLFDDDAWLALGTRNVQVARDAGALAVLPLALNYLATLRIFEGDLDVAAALLDEAEAIADATGAAPIVFGRLQLAAFRGDEAQTSALIEGSEPAAIARGEGVELTFAEHGRAVLHNGLGHYQAALDPAQSASAQDELMLSVWSLPELVEAAARCGRTDLAADALERLTERTQAAGTELALGIEARSRALLSDGEPADASTARQSSGSAAPACVPPWPAPTSCTASGSVGRTAAGTHASSCAPPTRGSPRWASRRSLNAAVASCWPRARPCASGWSRRAMSSPHRKCRSPSSLVTGLATRRLRGQLFLSTRTVEWHLRKVFSKLGIGSRRELRRALANLPRSAAVSS